VKRFYKLVAIAPEQNGWQVMLDGRGVRTPGKRAQLVPSRALAEAMAAEWAGQGDEIDAARLRFRDLADYAIDVVATDPRVAIDAILPYAGTDTLCYRADPGEALHRRQDELWEPLLSAAETRLDVRFVRASGIMHRPQPEATIRRLRDLVSAMDPLTLAGLQTLTSLAASLVIGLAALEEDADAASLWDAANLEEDWQAGLWGRDAEAEARRERRLADFAGAMEFVRAVRSGTPD